MYHLLSLHTCAQRTQFCPHCGSENYKRHGSFYRHEDARRVQRFYCNACSKTFSRAGYSLYYRHQYRHYTDVIRALFANGCTIRGIARILRINKDTVARRLVLLAEEARHRESLRVAAAPLAGTVQFDDLITFEHSKLKPLSVTVISDADRWRILGCTVAQIPASGLLAEKARKKYGTRPDKSIKARNELIKRTAPNITPKATIVTDQHKHYPVIIKRHLPKATHVAHKSIPSAIVGQGELKRSAKDPLFCINHQLAMLRANISRLFRRSWNTTKRTDRLEDHLCVFIDDYNRFRQPKSGKEFVRQNDLGQPQIQARDLMDRTG